MENFPIVLQARYFPSIKRKWFFQTCRKCRRLTGLTRNWSWYCISGEKAVLYVPHVAMETWKAKRLHLLQMGGRGQFHTRLLLARREKTLPPHWSIINKNETRHWKTRTLRVKGIRKLRFTVCIHTFAGIRSRVKRWGSVWNESFWNCEIISSEKNT